MMVCLQILVAWEYPSASIVKPH
ncbi:hypothetical protein LINGRAHAP2_LOCUS10201 [Linum grandiflorum]